nr:low temperature requirement protein A [Streptomyces sp. YIM 132580]
MAPGLGQHRAVPWLASLFTDDPWSYRLWLFGILVDLVALFAFSRNHALHRAQIHRAPERAPARHRRTASTALDLHEAHTNRAHLAERLGLYMTIVLGEGIIQVIDAVAEHWTLRLAATALAALALLAAIWTLSLLYGSHGLPHLHGAALSPRLTMLPHAAASAALAALATGLGAAVTHDHTHLPTPAQWLVCAALAFYFTVGLLVALPSHPGSAWIIAWALPCIAAPLVLAAFGQHLPTWASLWILTTTVGWQILFRRGPADGEG